MGRRKTSNDRMSRSSSKSKKKKSPKGRVRKKKKTLSFTWKTLKATPQDWEKEEGEAKNCWRRAIKEKKKGTPCTQGTNLEGMGVSANGTLIKTQRKARWGRASLPRRCPYLQVRKTLLLPRKKRG